jgi:uncharacterized protein
LQPELRARVLAEATVSPSEDADKVADAVSNVVSPEGGQVRRSGSKVSIEAADLRSLERLKNQLRDRHVRAAARRILVSGKRGNSATLMLNRQAAAAGTLAVCGSPGESPLGPIYVTLTSKRIDELIDWLTAYGTG